MLESVCVAIPVSIVLGFLSGLGTGGGSLLILWLTAVLGMEQPTARAINLMFFIPSALVAVIFHLRQGTFRLQPVIPAILSGCAAAYLCSHLGTQLDLKVLQKLFGALLIITGLRELLYHQNRRAR